MITVNLVTKVVCNPFKKTKKNKKKKTRELGKVLVNESLDFFMLILKFALSMCPRFGAQH